MENILWTAKAVMFLIIEAFVVGVIGVALIAGLYEIVRDKIRSSRLLDEVAPETIPTARKAS
jgi:hypothetical protein